ncbi:hypothetical protein [Bdellovibrio sp. BCCA]|uniref:hypothetical protein n=1 Tax=Bdellovibrio sp. BCCA TaxID=3136281 RepID=UPI0030F1583C
MSKAQTSFPIFKKLPLNEVRLAFTAYQMSLESGSKREKAEAKKDLVALRSLLTKKYKIAFYRSLELSHRVQKIQVHFSSAIEYCESNGVKFDLLGYCKRAPLYSGVYVYRDYEGTQRTYAFLSSGGPLKDFENITGRYSELSQGILDDDPIDTVDEATLILMWMLVFNKEYLIGMGSCHASKAIANEFGQTQKRQLRNT